MQDTTQVLENFNPEMFLTSDNPLIIAVLLFALLLVVSYLFFKFIIYPMQRQHYQTEQDLKNQIKIRLMQQAMKEQKVRSQLFHETVENERKRIATELHDGIGTILSSVKLQLEVVKYKHKMEDGSPIDKSIERLINAGGELRQVIHELRPLAIEKHGLQQALVNLISDFSTNASFTIEVEEVAVPPTLKEYVQISVYRVFQEILQNSVKHSKANVLKVNIYYNSKYFYLEYSDDGVGFPEEKIDRSKTKSGYGLNNIIERVSHNGGKCDIESEPGKGCRINIEIPLEDSLQTNEA